MQEILEFSEIEIPEKNLNPVNDIYKKNGVEGAFSSLVGLACISIIYTMVDIALFCLMFYFIVVLGERTAYYWGIFLFGVGGYVGIVWIKTNIKDLYRVHGYRKKIFANGTAYPGIVTEVEQYNRRYGAAVYGSLDLQEYVMQIRYADTSLRVPGIETDPQKCLENPYCTVYVWKGKAIATDFKVRKEYIAPNGKTHLIAPRKKGKRK